MNTWELCPKCKGEKKVWKNFGNLTTMDDFMDTVDCDICDGKGIISSITGLPPCDDFKIVDVKQPKINESTCGYGG
jgi:hypothetical protein